MRASRRRPGHLATVLAVAAIAALLAGCSDASEPVGTQSASPTPTPTPTALSAKAIKAAPTSLTLTCAPSGTLASTPLVATSPTGVQVVAVNATGEPRVIGYRISPTAGGEPVVGSLQPQAKSSAKPTLYALPPGRMEVRCGKSANTGLDDVVAVSILDRDKHYSSIDLEGTLGCSPTPLSPEKRFTDRSTQADALALMIEKLPAPGTYRVTDGPGYNGGQVTQHLVLRDGKGYGVATVTLLPNLSYRPALVATC